MLLPLDTGPSRDRADEGVRFVCPRQKLPEINLAMTAYLSSLAIAPNQVVRREDSAEGVLVYTLATKADDTSTLDLASRSALGIAPTRIRIPAGTDRFTDVATVSQKEILLALLQHGRLTELRGPSCSVEALADHVALRQNIVAWAANLRWGWPNGGPAAWNESYWHEGTPRRGVSLRQAMDDVFTNQGAYAIGCYTATKLVVVKGVLDYYDRVHASPVLSDRIESRLLADHEPLVDVEPGSAWSFEPDFDPSGARPGKLLAIVRGVAAKNFVPGDWVYFLNTDETSRQKVGYEGSNAIYLGAGRFDDYYGENEHAFTYEEKLDEVFQWRNGVWSRSRDVARRQPLTAGELERLGTTPGQGGLVEDWRIAPEFFAPALRRVAPPRAHGPIARTEPWPLPAPRLARRTGAVSSPRLAPSGSAAARLSAGHDSVAGGL